VGGATTSALWKQIFADVLGMPIICPKGNVEAPLGNTILAGVGTGVLKDYSVIKDWLAFEDRVMPDRDIHDIYTEYFKQYKELYPNIAGTMKELSRLGHYPSFRV
jgi:xylulokinase